MNELFVSIKVDREERPDVDAIYMVAVQAMTGHGGWPLTVFLTPDGVPFYAGTYFPPEPRQGMPSWPQCLTRPEAWRDKRDGDRRGARGSAAARRRAPRGAGRAARPGAARGAARRSSAATTASTAASASAPKFPAAGDRVPAARGERGCAAHAARDGARRHVRPGRRRLLALLLDERWLVPHFEKMLYDNALLARAYLHGLQVRASRLRARVRETLDWALREMRRTRAASTPRSTPTPRARRGILRLDARRVGRAGRAPDGAPRTSA